MHRACLLLMLCTALRPALAASPWIKLTTPHFELYTNAGEKKGREAILHFEQVRTFFLMASPSKRSAEFPVRIIAFKGEKDYKPYRINDFASAYYTASQKRDYIVMGDISAEHDPVAIHEYVHLITRHTGLRLPVWFNEGWADLYSTMKPAGKKVVVGELLRGRAQTVLSAKWIPLAQLVRVDHDSPLYNEKDKAGMFYAESWVLTHMLALSLDYRPNFGKFIAALSASGDMAEATQQAFGKTLAQVETDVRRYLQGGRIYGAVFDIQLTKSEEEAEVAAANAFESDMMLADLLVAAKKTAEAKTVYERLAQENPGRWEVDESLGYLAWQIRDNAAARRHFARALAAGVTDPQMCFQYALLEYESGAGDKTVVPILEKAVALKPDYLDARLQLGLARMNTGDYKGALADLKQIRKVQDDQAPRFFAALAYASALTNDFAEARRNAELAQKWSKAPADVAKAMEMMRYLDSRDQAEKETLAAAAAAPAREEVRFEPPNPTASPNPFIKRGEQVQRVQGLAQQLECRQNSARFHVLVDGKKMVFLIDDPSSVLIKHKGQTTVEFTCGPQKGYPVAVEYAEPNLVKSLEF